MISKIFFRKHLDPYFKRTLLFFCVPSALFNLLRKRLMVYIIETYSYAHWELFFLAYDVCWFCTVMLLVYTVLA